MTEIAVLSFFEYMRMVFPTLILCAVLSHGFAVSAHVATCLKFSPRRSELSSATSSSTATFTAALIFNAIVFGAELGVFTLVRPYFPAIYQPRTYVPPERYVATDLRIYAGADRRAASG